MNINQQQVHSYLQTLINDKPLYAIIDCAQDESIIQRLHHQAQRTPTQSLYEGQKGQELAPVAPYLAQFNSPDNALLKIIIEHGWDNNWAVYFKYPGEFEAARHQLRQCLRVGDTDQEYQTFRFYDPRVFRKMIPTFDMSQLIAFFGAIDSYWLEGIDVGNKATPNSNTLLHYQIHNLQLNVQSIALNKQPAIVPETIETLPEQQISTTNQRNTQ